MRRRASVQLGVGSSRAGATEVIVRSSTIVNVGDAVAATRFYRDVLGLPVVKSWTAPAGAATIFAIGPSATLELVGPPHAERVSQGPAHGVEIMIGVTDAAAWRDRLAADGVEIARELVVNPWGDRSFGVDDPDGRRVWIFERF